MRKREKWRESRQEKGGREEGTEEGRGSAWPGGSTEATHLSQY